MGKVQFSIPKQLIVDLQKEFKYKNFIETGTYKGETCIWASAYFEQIFTIEIDPKLSLEASQKANNHKNIEFIIGDSSTELSKISSKLTSSSIFWLDGHWCIGVNKLSDECPILNEIESLSGNSSDIILIDDARFFMEIVPVPHDQNQWPRIDEVLGNLKRKYPNHFILIEFDVIMCLPRNVFDFIQQFIQNQKLNSLKIEENRRNGLKQFFKQLKSRIADFFIDKSPGQTSLTSVEQLEHNSAQLKIHSLLKANKVNTLIDIGASSGEFTSNVLLYNNGLRAFLFEPVNKAFKDLHRKYASNKLIRLYNLAIGSQDGEVQFNENDYYYSSSILSMNEDHFAEFPQTTKFQTHSVRIAKLSSVVDIKDIQRPLMIKIDVQGYEREVISGAKNILTIADFLIIEVSYYELYSNQPLFDEIYNLLKELGFIYKGNLYQIYSSKSSKVLQADALFVRES